MRVMFEEYCYKITQDAAFRVDIDAVVVETGQCHSVEEDFRLRRPDIEVIVRTLTQRHEELVNCKWLLQGPEAVKQGEEFEIVAKFESTMGIHLNNCFWELESNKMFKPFRLDEM